MLRAFAGWLLLLFFLGWLPIAEAQDVPQKPRSIKVGLVPMPPLVVDDGNGEWSGIAVEVWRETAKSLGWEYQLFPFSDHLKLIDAINNREVDLAIPSFPVSALAPSDIAFSQPFFSSQYAVAVSPLRWRFTWLNSLGALINVGILEFILALLGLLLFGGILIWLCERRKNPAEFGGSFLQGLGHGVWWSAVTMTTVGYGDKSPQTLAGRMVAFVWMFSGFILLSVFVSALVSNISSKVHSGMDAIRTLKGMHVGVMTDSPASVFLKTRGIKAQEFSNIASMVDAFSKHEIDAMFADSAHLLRVNWQPVGVHPLVISQSSGSNWYAFALHPDSELEEPLNRAILKFIQEPKWARITSAAPGLP